VTCIALVWDVYRARSCERSCVGYDADGTITNRMEGAPSGLVRPVGLDTSPAVMLSPNARNFVRVSCGAGAATVTLKVHDAVACAASVAVHRTVVVPTGKIEADAGVQLFCTGDRPPLTTGEPKVTAMPLLAVAVTFWFAGQLMLSAGDCPPGGGCCGGCVGEVGDEHPNVAASASSSATLLGRDRGETGRVMTPT
jgi:hypothetical protein